MTLCLVLFPNKAVELYDASLALIVLVYLLALIKAQLSFYCGCPSQSAPYALRLAARAFRSNHPDPLVAQFILSGVYLDPKLRRCLFESSWSRP